MTSTHAVAARRTGTASSVRLPGRPRLVDAPAVTTVPGSQYAFLGLTARVVDRILRSPVLPSTPAALALAADDALIVVTTALTKRARRASESSDRADLPPRAEVVRAHGAAGRYLRCWRPDPDLGLTYAGAEVAAATRDELPPDLTRALSDTWPRGRRLAWAADPDDLRAGVLLDRLSPTHLPDQAYSAWMAAQVAADLRLGKHLAGDAFAGVRVLLPLVPAASLHVLPDTTRHPLGHCPVCRTRSLPLPGA